MIKTRSSGGTISRYELVLVRPRKFEHLARDAEIRCLGPGGAGDAHPATHRHIGALKTSGHSAILGNLLLYIGFGGIGEGEDGQNRNQKQAANKTASAGP